MKQNSFWRMELGRLGVILSNYSILSMFIMLSSILLVIMYGLGILLWALFLVITLGGVLLIVPNYMQLLSSNSLAKQLIEFFTPILPYLYWIALGTAVASIVLMNLGTGKKPTGHIIFSAIVCVVCLLFILGIVGGAR
ncbi:MAG: hypothetical protein ACI4L7_00055 [Christensenellales bacterium]